MLCDVCDCFWKRKREGFKKAWMFNNEVLILRFEVEWLKVDEYLNSPLSIWGALAWVLTLWWCFQNNFPSSMLSLNLLILFNFKYSTKTPSQSLFRPSRDERDVKICSPIITDDEKVIPKMFTTWLNRSVRDKTLLVWVETTTSPLLSSPLAL